jgi:transposase-like protein
MTARPDGTPRRLLEQAAPLVRPLAGADPDALRQLVQELVQTTLERDFARFLGAAPYERAPERRGVRNGTRPRTLVTRVGRLALKVPRDRESLFEPAVFARYQRHEQALLGTLAECYLQGVSTRKVRSVVEAARRRSLAASPSARRS